MGLCLNPLAVHHLPWRIPSHCNRGIFWAKGGGHVLKLALGFPGLVGMGIFSFGVTVWYGVLMGDLDLTLVKRSELEEEE